MPTLFNVTKFRLLVIAVLFFMAPLLNAADSPTSNAVRSHNITSQSQTASLHAWVYKELVSIQKEVSAIDANGVTKESVQTLKDRLFKVEAKLEESQLRVDDTLKLQGERIGDIYASTDRFGLIAGSLGVAASFIAVLFAWISAGRKAKLEAKKHVKEWLENNKKDLDKQLNDAKNFLEKTMNEEIYSAKKQIKDFIDLSEKDIEEVKLQVKELDIITEKFISRLNSDLIITSEEQKEIIIEAKQTLTKAEKDRIAIDWLVLAIESYFNENYEESLGFINKSIDYNNLSGKLTVAKLAGAMSLKANILAKLNLLDEELIVYEDILSRFEGYNSKIYQELISKTLLNKGIVLVEKARFDEAIDIYDDLISYFRVDQATIVCEQVAKALINKGVLLEELNRFKEAIAAYDNLIEKFSDNEEIDIQKEVAIALVNKGIVQYKLKKPNDEINTYNHLLEKFEDSEELIIQEQITTALVNKGIRQGYLGLIKEEIKTYDFLIKKFGENKNLSIQEKVARVLLNKAIRLGELAQPEEEIHVYDKLIMLFENKSELVIQEKVAIALLHKGITLGELGLFDKANLIYDNLIMKFKDSNEPVIKKQIDTALSIQNQMKPNNLGSK